jgi:sialic acid synthase SpsE
VYCIGGIKTVFIICEAGVNWRDLVDADDMIREAAKAGADAVKFQCYKPVFGTNKDSALVATGRYHPRANELNAIALDEPTIRYLYWRCQQHGIEFMCTPFYAEAVEMLDPFVKRWKVRCADNQHIDIIQACIRTGKEILISIEEPRRFLYSKMKGLYCCPEYPPKHPIDEITLEEFKLFDGFSCHYPSVSIAHYMAVNSMNCKYLEVHVRLDRYEPHYCPIDTAVSITMSELAELCRRLKG